MPHYSPARPQGPTPPRRAIGTKFNINDTVLVKITERGMEILRNNHSYALGHLAEKYPFQEPAKDEHGYSRMQLYHLASHFGPYLRVGETDLPIETEIVLPDPL